MTYQEIIASIRRFHADTSRSAEETLEGLEEIADEVGMLMGVMHEEKKK